MNIPLLDELRDAVKALTVTVDKMHDSLVDQRREYLTHEEASERLRMSERTLERLVEDGSIRQIRIGGARRYRAEWLDEDMSLAAVGGTTRRAALRVVNR